MSRRQPLVMPLVAGALLVGVWYAVKGLLHIPSIVLPAPHEIVEAGWDERKSLWDATLITGAGAVLGFLAAVGIGFLLSFAMAFSPRLKQSLYPYILILQMTPVIILAPIFALWLGQGLPSVVAVTFMICFFPVVANTTMGFLSTEVPLRELFVLCKATRLQEVRFLRVPAAMPFFLTGAKIAGTLAPIGAITGDFLAGTSQNGEAGLGYLTIVYFSQLKIPALFAAGGVACILGFGFVGAVNSLHWLLLRRWHDSMIKKE